MEPYNRIMNSVQRRRTDRLPIDYIATPEFNTNLKKHWGIDDNETLLRKVGSDIRRVSARFWGLWGMGQPGRLEILRCRH